MSGLGWVAREWRDGETGRNSVSVYVALIQTDVAGLTVYELLNKMVRNKTSGALPGRISCGNNNRMLLWLIHKLVLGASAVYCIRFGVSFAWERYDYNGKTQLGNIQVDTWFLIVTK